MGEYMGRYRLCLIMKTSVLIIALLFCSMAMGQNSGSGGVNNVGTEFEPADPTGVNGTDSVHPTNRAKAMNQLNLMKPMILVRREDRYSRYWHSLLKLQNVFSFIVRKYFTPFTICKT